MHTTKTAFSIISKEIETGDLCFPGHGHIPGGQGQITTDRMASSPDITTHVFSTMGDNLYQVTRDGIILPIKVNNIAKYINKQSLSQEYYKEYGDEGVYIIKSFLLYDASPETLKKMISYYLDTHSSTEVTFDSIRSHLNDYLLDNNRSRILTLRIIKFVSKRVLLNHKNVYVEDLGTTLSVGMPTTKHTINEIDKTESAIIDINIIDNMSKNKIYYLMVGNEAVAVPSKQSNTKSCGCTMKVYTNGYEVKNNEVGLEKLNDLGIYSTVDEALYNGDVKNKIEHLKGLQKNEKLEQARVNTTVAYNKMDHTEYLAKLELEHKKIAFENSLLKEFALIEQNSLNNTLVLSKHALENEYLLSKSERDDLNFQRELELLNRKTDVQNTATNFNLLTSALKLL
jgi:hypothetical protein